MLKGPKPRFWSKNTYISPQHRLSYAMEKSLVSTSILTEVNFSNEVCKELQAIACNCKNTYRAKKTSCTTFHTNVWTLHPGIEYTTLIYG